MEKQNNKKKDKLKKSMELRLQGKRVKNKNHTFIILQLTTYVPYQNKE